MPLSLFEIVGFLLVGAIVAGANKRMSGKWFWQSQLTPKSPKKEPGGPFDLSGELLPLPISLIAGPMYGSTGTSIRLTPLQMANAGVGEHWYVLLTNPIPGKEKVFDARVLLAREADPQNRKSLIRFASLSNTTYLLLECREGQEIRIIGKFPSTFPKAALEAEAQSDHLGGCRSGS